MAPVSPRPPLLSTATSAAMLADLQRYRAENRITLIMHASTLVIAGACAIGFIIVWGSSL